MRALSRFEVEISDLDVTAHEVIFNAVLLLSMFPHLIFPALEEYLRA
jgi:hypothetical protein